MLVSPTRFTGLVNARYFLQDRLPRTPLALAARIPRSCFPGTLGPMRDPFDPPECPGGPLPANGTLHEYGAIRPPWGEEPGSQRIDDVTPRRPLFQKMPTMQGGGR